ncbi:MAG: long-chain-fatty-acid--CoA ligase [Halioglobus sp.]
MLAGQMMNLPLTITTIMDFAEQVHGDSEIVSVTADNPAHRYTYADAFRRTRQLANALDAAGMEEGDRIATLAWNDYRHFELYYGISCSGAVCHTINPRLFPEQVDYIVNHAQDKLIFTDPAFLPLLEGLQDRLVSVEKYIVLTDAANMPATSLKGAQDYESFIAGQSEEYHWPELDENAASALCYTSGTTGNPKGVLYSHRSTVLHSYGAALPDTMALSVNDTLLPIVPMFHVNAWSIPYAAAMIGCKLVMPGSKMGDGETLQGLIEREGVTMSAGVPTVWLALLAYLRESGKSVESLQRVVVGGAACPLSIMEEFQERHGVYTHHAWGMTETGPLGVLNTLKPGMADLPKAELDAIKLKQGRPVFGVDVRIVDDEGKVQPWDGEAVGEVRVKGNWICSGYFGIDAPDSHDENGYFGTGDVACMDPDGYMKITDRTKDVIKSGGEWISSIDLENAAVGHPAVAEAAVIGVPHPKWTERPLLVVVKAPGTDVAKEEILAYLEGKVAKWWIPEDAVFVEELPHTATGKISKKDLRVQLKDYQHS